MDGVPHVVVIGGGISGLACASRLAEHGDLSVTLLEASGRLGGHIATERLAQGLIEHGPDGFVSWRREVNDLATAAGVELIQSAPGLSSILRAGRMHPIPAGLLGAVPSALMPTLRSALLGPRGKLRLLTEPLRPGRPDGTEETAGQFIRRRAGRQVWERIAEPFISGLHAADGERLAAAAVLPALVAAEREHGSIARAAVRSRRSRRQHPAGATFTTAPTGMEEIVAAVARRLEERAEVRTNASVGSIGIDGLRWTVATADGQVRADAVVVATQPGAAARLVADLDRALAAELAAIPCADAAVVAFVLPAERIRPDAGTGHLVPRTEGSPVVACSVATAKFPRHAVPGHAVVRVFLGRFGDATPDLPDHALVDIAREHIERTLGVAGEPEQTRVIRIRDAFPQYVVGHADRVARIRDMAGAHPGLYLTGAAYEGIGIPDCVRQAQTAADRAAAYLAVS